MDTTTFERLWLKRSQLSREQVEELEQAQESDEFCKAFAEEGGDVHTLLRRVKSEAPPADFSYRMRVYAQNNKAGGVSLFEKTTFRWAGLGVGLALGASLITIGLDGVSVTNPVGTSASLVNADSISRTALTVEPEESLNVSKEQFMSHADSIGNISSPEKEKVAKEIPQSAMKLQMVSGSSGFFIDQ